METPESSSLSESEKALGTCVRVYVLGQPQVHNSAAAQKRTDL